MVSTQRPGGFRNESAGARSVPQAKSVPVAGPRQEPRSVIGAILDQVEARAEAAPKASELFRAQALEHLDVAADVDARLTLVSRRSWLAIATIGLVLSCGIVWAALTPSIGAVEAKGRVDGDGRVVLALPESQSLGIVPGTPVRIPGGPDATVVEVEAPEWPAAARDELMIPIDDGEPVVRVVAAPGSPLPAGTLLTARVVTDESTVLRRLLDRS